jgi:hypothetical protein
VRGLLFGGRYTEFDLVNCQPTIMLSWAARKYDLGLPTLRLYADRRAAFITLLVDSTTWQHDTDMRGAAKQLVVRLCFGGTVSAFETERRCTLTGAGKAFAEGVAKDVADLMAAFVADTDLYDYFKACDTKKHNPRARHDALDRRLFSLVLQDAEYQCTRAAEAEITRMGLVTGFRIFDALFVECKTVPDDTAPVLNAMEEAANECIDFLFQPEPHRDSIFERTPLAFSCEPLVATTSLSEFVMREVGFDIEQVDDIPEQVRNGDDVAFWKAFCRRVSKRLVMDCNKKMYWRHNEDGLWCEMLSDGHAPIGLIDEIRAFGLELEADDADLKIKWGKSQCGAYSWSAYISGLKTHARKYSGEMWYANNPLQPEIALFDCVYHVLNDTTRKYNADDYFVCKLALDFKAWDEQDKDEMERYLRLEDEGFFEEDVARERAQGRLALAALMCNGNFRKKALVFKGRGNNGKSACVSRVKHMLVTLAAPGGEPYHWVTESSCEALWGFTGEINVSLVETLRAKVVVIDEGSKIKTEPFKKFTGGPGSAGGARLPYCKSTQMVRNHCVPIFNSNEDITFDTVGGKPPDQAALTRLEVITFKVTNHPSAAALEDKVAAIIADAKQSALAARAHSGSELRKFASAVRRGEQLSPFQAEAVAHHEQYLATTAIFDEAEARESLARYHRVGDMFYADQVRLWRW